MSERYYLGDDSLDQAPRNFLFDTNVWIWLQGPLQDHASWQARAYSRFYKSAIDAGSSVYLPQVVGGEFVRRSLTIIAEASGWQRGPEKLHQRQEYFGWMSDAVDGLHAIASDSVRLNDHFDQLDIEAVCQAATSERLDFNDLIIMRLCQANDLILVTHDKDFSGQPIPIVTANRKLT